MHEKINTFGLTTKVKKSAWVTSTCFLDSMEFVTAFEKHKRLGTTRMKTVLLVYYRL